MRTRGSNQFQNKYGLSKDALISVWQVAALTATGIVLIVKLSPGIVSPCPDSGCAVKMVYAAEGKTELQEITDYIVRKFEPEGRQVAVKALDCFISESGLRPDAININKNGTWDYGLAQWNQVHGQKIEDLKDWKHQIDLAYRLYKRSGWKPWYGAGCR